MRAHRTSWLAVAFATSLMGTACGSPDPVSVEDTSASVASPDAEDAPSSADVPAEVAGPEVGPDAEVDAAAEIEVAAETQDTTGDDTDRAVAEVGPLELGPPCDDAPLTSLATGEAIGCLDDAWPCGWALTGVTCGWQDEPCPDEQLCFRKHCLAATGQPGDAGCIEGQTWVRNGGSAPDRLYFLDVAQPAYEAAGGAALTATDHLYAHQHVWCSDFSIDECIPVGPEYALAYGTDGLSAEGGVGDLTLMKLKAAGGTPLAPGWSAGSVTLTWSYEWEFGPGGWTPPIGDTLVVISFFDTDGGCAEVTTYELTLSPYGPADDVTAEAAQSTVCP